MMPMGMILRLLGYDSVTRPHLNADTMMTAYAQVASCVPEYF